MTTTKFKKTCLAVIDEVYATRESVVITKRGKPYLRLEPAGRPKPFLGSLKGKVKIVGDIESPVVPAEAWLYDLNNLDSEPDP